MKITIESTAKIVTLIQGLTCPTITVYTDKCCPECGKPGAVQSGICVSCTTKALSDQPMKSAIGRAVQARFKSVLSERGP